MRKNGLGRYAPLSSYEPDRCIERTLQMNILLQGQSLAMANLRVLCVAGVQKRYYIIICQALAGSR